MWNAYATSRNKLDQYFLLFFGTDNISLLMNGAFSGRPAVNGGERVQYFQCNRDVFTGETKPQFGI